jgi:hypothetical protein
MSPTEVWRNACLSPFCTVESAMTVEQSTLQQNNSKVANACTRRMNRTAYLCWTLSTVSIL